MRNWATQASPMSNLRLDDRRIAECEGVDQARPGLEAADASAANPPAAEGCYRGVVGARKQESRMGYRVIRPVMRPT